MSSGIGSVATSELRDSYDSLLPIAINFKEKLLEEIGATLNKADVRLATPMEGRVKTWHSTVKKIETSNLTLNDVSELEDLIGIRLILLFKRDINRVCETISRTFDVLSMEDTGSRLGQSEFGYQSIHMQIQAPESWLALPSFSAFRGITAEIQVRTASQHLWATASHLLQYKAEEGVPIPLRRSIHRVSALLEVVDLEFERVLQDRERYLEQIHEFETDTALDVDVLKHTLDANLPLANREDDDDYARLLVILINAQVNTVGDLLNLFEDQKGTVLGVDARIASFFADPDSVKTNAEEGEEDDETEYAVVVDGKRYAGLRSAVERGRKGAFYSHIGLVRMMLEMSGNQSYI